MAQTNKKISTEIQPTVKSIRTRDQDFEQAEKIRKKFNTSVIASRVLAAREFNDNSVIENYLQPTLQKGIPAPSKLKNLDQACALVSETIAKKQKIAICCDFDVDGLSGGSQVQAFFMSIDVPSKVFVPDRFTDGYGLNSNMVQRIADEGFSLIITVDYGTTNATEIALAKELGLKTIVVDHHHVGDHNPGADVFINPNQEGCNFADKILCASALAWYLILGLKKELPEAKDVDAKSYLDLACLGTICDMVPLIGANRVIAKRGLELLTQTERPGLIALKDVLGIHKDVTCANISFGIGPRINAAGRMVHGDLVIELLTTDSSIKAEKLARRLHKLNLERQDTEERVKNEAIRMVQKNESLPNSLVVWHPKFHTGVVGIVAQRLVENFYRPSVVLGSEEDGIFKGSVRGIKGFNVVEALGEAGEKLIKFGGHEGAGGLSIAEADLPSFAEKFEQVCTEKLKTIETSPYVSADTEIELIDLELDLVKELRKFAPFGVGNPGPVLLIKNLKVMGVKILKGAHLKVSLSDGKRYVDGLMWKRASHPHLFHGSRVNVAIKPDTNSYGGRTDVQAVLLAVESA